MSRDNEILSRVRELLWEADSRLTQVEMILDAFLARLNGETLESAETQRRVDAALAEREQFTHRQYPNV